jgi:hypothetical protein
VGHKDTGKNSAGFLRFRSQEDLSKRERKRRHNVTCHKSHVVKMHLRLGDSSVAGPSPSMLEVQGFITSMGDGGRHLQHIIEELNPILHGMLL